MLSCGETVEKITKNFPYFVSNSNKNSPQDDENPLSLSSISTLRVFSRDIIGRTKSPSGPIGLKNM